MAISRNDTYGTLYLIIGSTLLLYHLGILQQGALGSLIHGITTAIILAFMSYGLVLTNLHSIALSLITEIAEQLKAYSERHTTTVLSSTMRGYIYICLSTILLMNQYELLGTGALAQFSHISIMIIVLGMIGQGLALTGLGLWIVKRITHNKDAAKAIAHNVHKNQTARGIMYLVLGFLLALSMLGIIATINSWLLVIAGVVLFSYGAYLLQIHTKAYTYFADTSQK